MTYPSMTRAERETEAELQAASQARAEQAAQDYAVREAARRKAEQAAAAERETARQRAAAELAEAQHARAAAALAVAKAEARQRWLAAGGEVHLEAAFRDINGVLADPSTIVFTIRAPDGTETVYTYSAAEVSRSGTGVYYRDVTPDVGGHWAWRAESTGNPQTAEEDTFYVTARWEGA